MVPINNRYGGLRSALRGDCTEQPQKDDGHAREDPYVAGSSAGTELAELLGIKSAAKGVKVQIIDGVVNVDTIIQVRYGCNAVAVAEAVQNVVSNTVQSMTGMGKPVVNVHISGVAFEK